MSQLSSVQRLPSSQFGGTPPTQAPAEQVSAVVQASPSSQAVALLAFTQPVRASQLSSVQPLPSSQLGGCMPRQAPRKQKSWVVQALPSSQAAVLFTLSQPTAALQLSSVHRSPSSQSVGASETQVAPTQVSLAVQASPSSQLPTSSEQADEQQSPSTVPPSSHCSASSTMPLPQTDSTYTFAPVAVADIATPSTSVTVEAETEISIVEPAAASAGTEKWSVATCTAPEGEVKLEPWKAARVAVPRPRLATGAPENSIALPPPTLSNTASAAGQAKSTV